MSHKPQVTSTSICPQGQTPPSSPSESPRLAPQQHITWGGMKNLLEAVLKGQSAPSAESPAGGTQDSSQDQGKSVDRRSEASKPEYKKVLESWDKTNSKYKIVESTEPAPVFDEEQYAFIVREHINGKTQTSTTYIDVKSESLRDILRPVLKDVQAASLMEPKPSIEQTILFHFLPELKNQLATSVEAIHADRAQEMTTVSSRHVELLRLLINYVEEASAEVQQRLELLLQCGKITYDLLPALFKPGAFVYTRCLGSEKPRCVIFDAGEEDTQKGVTFYKLECRYLDYNGQTFGETGIMLAIPRFRSAKPIHSLDAFPLKYHPEREAVRKDLIRCGREFCRLIDNSCQNPAGIHLRHCKGTAFVMKNYNAIKLSINSRVAIDAAFFSKMEPNYSRPRVQDNWKDDYIISISELEHQSELEQLKDTGDEPSKMTDNKFMICSPTVPGFCFEKKCFLQCAVADLQDVVWSPGSFDQLQIPEDTKKLLVSVASARLCSDDECVFDDFLAQKGRGVNVLLYGQPGVGKTFTVEAASERFGMPLYSISAGELIADHGDPLQLDQALGRIFKIARHFNAILLLDEADVFMEKRAEFNASSNRLVTIFLRKLEYYEGILFLTTNRPMEFDQAALSRIHLKVEYQELTKQARRKIWTSFLPALRTSRGPCCIDDRDLQRLESWELSGRDIKNFASVAHAMATFDKVQVTYEYLERAVKSHDEFARKFANTGRMEGLYT